MKQERFIYLINQYVAKTISPEETRELRDLLTEMDQPALTEFLSDDWLAAARPAFLEPGPDEDLHKKIAGIVAVDKSLPRLPVKRRIWFRYAAAAVLILGLGLATYFHLANRNLPGDLAQTTPSHDVEPGRQTALLTLADGSTISLDSAGNGALAMQGNAAITKLAGGRIVYQPNGIGKGKPLMNTMATPRGGQYQLVLPDGTKVWLNAASAITYPVTFEGERKVKIKGEAYFEVAQDKTPFIVDIDGKSSIQVLGTHFNINAYTDEENIRTTLVEGKIRVVENAAEQRPAKSVILKPGQQAVIIARDAPADHPVINNRRQQGENNIAVLDHPDMEQVLAWKNGLISLENVAFPDLMRQLERWYDIRIKYEGAIPEIKFKGEMDREVRLSGVLRFLQNFGVRTRLEGKTLIILEN